MTSHADWLTHLLATERRVKLRRVGNIARRALTPAPGLDPQARINELQQSLADILSIVEADRA